MSSREARVNALKDATVTYVGKEKTRIDNEVAVLDAIKNGRNAGVQAISVNLITEVANNNLYAYLNGD